MTTIALSLISIFDENYPHQAYLVIKFMRDHGLDYIKSLPIYLKECAFRPSPCGNALSFIKIAIQVDDWKLVCTLVKEFFYDNDTDPTGPLQGKQLHDQLTQVLNYTVQQGNMEDALSIAQCLPLNHGTGSELRSLEKILSDVLLEKCLVDDSANALKIITDLLLNRRQILLVRKHLSCHVFNNTKLNLYQYLEQRCIYKFPRIAQYAHLVIIPYGMSKTEMSLAIFRHLVELAMFLTELKAPLRSDLSLRIVLKMNSELQPVPEKHRDPRYRGNPYEKARDRLKDTLFTVMRPPLSLERRREHPFKISRNGEVIFNVNIQSVRDWMLKNTIYNEDDEAEANQQQSIVSYEISSVINCHIEASINTRCGAGRSIALRKK